MPDLDETCRCIGSIDKMMAVAFSGGKPGRGAGTQGLLAVIGHQDQLAFEDVDEFVLISVPVTLS